MPRTKGPVVSKTRRESEYVETMERLLRGEGLDDIPEIDPDDLVPWEKDPRLSDNAKKTMALVLRGGIEDFLFPLLLKKDPALVEGVEELRRLGWVRNIDRDIREYRETQFRLDLQDQGVTIDDLS